MITHEKISLEQAYQLAGEVFGPIFGVEPQEFADLLRDLDQKSFLDTELKHKLQHPIKFGPEDVLRVETLKINGDAE